MRRLLMSAAVLGLLVAPASAQPNPDRVGKAAAAPDVQDRAQAQLDHPAPARPAPEQGGGHFDRGGARSQPAMPGAQPGPQNPQQGSGHFDRGDARPQPAAPSAHPGPQNQNRGDRDRGDRGDRGNWQGRPSNGNNFNRPDNRPGYGQGNNFTNRPGFGNPGYGGPRHDFRSFRDFHRSFNASRRFRAPYYRRPAGWYDHRWSFGEYLPPAYWARDYWLDDYMAYDLPPPPYGAVWVRVGNDALLVDEESGEVITIEYGVFY